MNHSSSDPASPATTPSRKPRSRWLDVTIVVVIIGLLVVLALSGTAPYPHWKGYLVEMKSDLVSLRTAEELSFDSTGKYIRDVGPPLFIRTPGVNPPTITVADTAWSATITSVRFPAARCGIAVGMPNPVDRRAADGMPACVYPNTGPGTR